MTSKSFRFENSVVSGEGVPEIQPHDLNAHRTEVHVVDVRRADEFTGELGHVPGSELQTLETDFARFVAAVPAEHRSDTFVFVCRSGGRSAKATAFARQSGVPNCYNLIGGMLYWNELGLGVEK